MTRFLILLFLFSGTFAFSQNTSFGIGIHAASLEGNQGVYFTGDLRVQFSEKIGWQTEVGFASLNETSTIFYEETIPQFGQIVTFSETQRMTAITLKSSLALKMFTFNGLTGEAIIGGGIFVDNDDMFGLLSGEFFLSTKIGKNIVAGIPLSYNYITYQRDQMYTAGVSIRFHM